MVMFDNALYLFKDFHTKLARMKLASEYFPDNCTTEEQKQAYVDKLNQDMCGLNLKVSDMSNNPHLRAFAKDFGNIQLGKMSQDDHCRKSTYVTTWQEISEIKYCYKNTLKQVVPILGELAEVIYDVNPAFMGYSKNTNVIIYSILTGYARTSMYIDMCKIQKLGGSLYYSDTDSIIFSYKKNAAVWKQIEETFNIGSKVYGAYKIETKSPISQYCSLGAKNYAITTTDGEETVKVRGFTLKDDNVKKIINHTSMRDILRDWVEKETRRTLKVTTKGMKPNRKRQTVKNYIGTKNYRNDTYDKRWVLKDDPNMTTLPFGIRSMSFQEN